VTSAEETQIFINQIGRLSKTAGARLMVDVFGRYTEKSRNEPVFTPGSCRHCQIGIQHKGWVYCSSCRQKYVNAFVAIFEHIATT
jgi:hypothetical protein